MTPFFSFKFHSFAFFYHNLCSFILIKSCFQKKYVFYFENNARSLSSTMLSCMYNVHMYFEDWSLPDWVDFFFCSNHETSRDCEKRICSIKKQKVFVVCAAKTIFLFNIRVNDMQVCKWFCIFHTSNMPLIYFRKYICLHIITHRHTICIKSLKISPYAIRNLHW